MNLFEISAKYQQIMQDIMDSDELSNEQLQSIEVMADSMEDKAKEIGSIIKNMEAQYKAIQEACMIMESRSIKLSNKIEGIREFLKTNLEKCDIKKIESPWFDINIRYNAPSVTIIDNTMIPEQYFRESTIKTINKMLISQELKNNVMIPGVRLEKKTRLEIR